VTGVAQDLQGNYELLDAAQDTGPYSARTFVSVDQSSFSLQPGGSQNVTATIQVPQDAGNGGRYAIINIAEQPVAGTGVSIISAVNVPVYLTIQGSNIVQTGKITSLTTNTVTSGQTIGIMTNFQNTGNLHYHVQGQVTVKNPQGQTLATIPIPLTSSSVLPGMTRQLVTNFIPTDALPAGTYAINAKVTMDNDTLLDQTSSSFTLTNQYAPPSATTSQAVANQQPALGTANLTPSGATTLQNADDSISIDFPQGAAVAAVAVSLQSYSIDQITSVPPGATLASTCFQVTGLTGLLAKDATLAVKYSPTDLSQASGNASRLELARWDGGTSWTVFKTNVNTGTITLTASSNQMGIWAVVVGSSASSGISWTIIGIIIAVVIVVVAGVVTLFLSRRKRGHKQKAN